MTTYCKHLSIGPEGRCLTCGSWRASLAQYREMRERAERAEARVAELEGRIASGTEYESNVATVGPTDSVSGKIDTAARANPQSIEAAWAETNNRIEMYQASQRDIDRLRKALREAAGVIEKAQKRLEDEEHWLKWLGDGARAAHEAANV